MSTRRIYLEGLKETDENADKKIYAGNNYSGYNRVSIRRKRSLYVKKLFAGFFSIIMNLNAFIILSRLSRWRAGVQGCFRTMANW